MSGLRRSAFAAVAIVATAIVGLTGRAERVAAATCRSPSVAVVVDFGSLGGGIQRACVSGGGTGLTALSADFSVTLVRNQAFVCGINGKPYRTTCPSVPPNEKSWSYWHANPGATGWTYSTTGAASYRPKPGSAEGWAFGGSSHAPRVSPAAVLPAPPVPKSTTPHTAPRRVPSPTTARPSTRATTTTAATSASSRSRAPTAHTSSTSARTGMGVPVTEVSRPPASTKPKSGSPLSTVLGLGVLAVLGAGGWLLLRRRRRPGQSTDRGIS